MEHFESVFDAETLLQDTNTHLYNISVVVFPICLRSDYSWASRHTQLMFCFLKISFKIFITTYNSCTPGIMTKSVKSHCLLPINSLQWPGKASKTNIDWDHFRLECLPRFCGSNKAIERVPNDEILLKNAKAQNYESFKGSTLFSSI